MFSLFLVSLKPWPTASASVEFFISIAADGEYVPIPTLLPVTTKSPLLYCPITIVPSSKASKTGKPAMSLTLINEPVKLSSTLNNDPCEPSTSNAGWESPD